MIGASAVEKDSGGRAGQKHLGIVPLAIGSFLASTDDRPLSAKGMIDRWTDQCQTDIWSTMRYSIAAGFAKWAIQQALGDIADFRL